MSLIQHIEILRRLPLFASLSPETMEHILTGAPIRWRRFEKGELIAVQGKLLLYLMVLVRGKVRGQMESNEGKRLTIDFIDAPDILAPAFVYSSSARLPVSVQALEDCTLLYIDRDYLLRLMGEHPTMMQAYLQDISDRSLFLSQKINALSLSNLRDRLLGYLTRHETHISIEELALLLGVARPSLSRIISELVEEGLIERHGQKLRLSSPNHSLTI